MDALYKIWPAGEIVRLATAHVLHFAPALDVAVLQRLWPESNKDEMGILLFGQHDRYRRAGQRNTESGHALPAFTVPACSLNLPNLA
jgi:hypothetical protein